MSNEDKLTSTSRRAALKQFFGGLLVGIPAITMIANPLPASAKPGEPPHKHCVSTKWKLVGCKCICKTSGNWWTCTYKEVCTVCLAACGATMTEVSEGC
jgi:hypothetical protein